MNSNQTMALLMLGVESTDGENSVGHAYLAGMKFDISKLKLCKTASDKENCLLTKRNSYGQLIPELYSCSFYPEGQLRDDQRDIRRVDRMYFKKEPSFGGDEFITKIVKSELIDELRLSIRSYISIASSLDTTYSLITVSHSQLKPSSNTLRLV